MPARGAPARKVSGPDRAMRRRRLGAQAAGRRHPPPDYWGRAQGVVRVGGRGCDAPEPVIMAIVNRTPDSFYDQGATFRDEPALARVEQAVSEGAAIVDIGGVKAGPGEEVSAEEEARRTVGFVAEVRRRFPDVVISVDNWGAGGGGAVWGAGGDLLHDAWGGVEPRAGGGAGGVGGRGG